MEIRLATTDAEIEACYPVMRELRPHLEDAAAFVARVRLQEKSGYQMACLRKTAAAKKHAITCFFVAVAGFRIMDNLAWGRFLYVDDLVTLAAHRSHGHGQALLAWLREYAAAQGCAQLHLDSGVQRKAAHRFYERAGLDLSCYHYQVTTKS